MQSNSILWQGSPEAFLSRKFNCTSRTPSDAPELPLSPLAFELLHEAARVLQLAGMTLGHLDVRLG